jgi:hypothetical protein
MTYLTAQAYAERNIPGAWLYGWTGNVAHMGDSLRRQWGHDFAEWCTAGGWRDHEHVDAAFDRWVAKMGGRETSPLGVTA